MKMLDFAQAAAVVPRAASTTLVVRDGPSGLEVLMVRLHGDSGVLGGVHVFPGGKLDADDGTALPVGASRDASWYAETLGEPTLSPAVARGLFTAAVRETREECGLNLPVDTLWPWSRWITPRQPSVTRKRFDTRFFVAPAPAGQEAVHDDFEATEALWVLPRPETKMPLYEQAMGSMSAPSSKARWASPTRWARPLRLQQKRSSVTMYSA